MLFSLGAGSVIIAFNIEFKLQFLRAENMGFDPIRAGIIFIMRPRTFLAGQSTLGLKASN